jgi:queuine tRNA-ribosyltransferase subunit QTRTD1
VSLFTSVGYRSISSEYYAAAARKLQPDIVVGLADIPFGQESVGIKRKDKMSDRTEVWTRDIIAKRKSMTDSEPRFNIFAPLLPIDRDLQSWYLEHVVDEMVDDISGIAIYDAYLLDDLPEELHHLPRLSFHIPAGPQELLRQIGLGMDLFTIPFISSATDAGIALDFTFPPPPKGDSSFRQSLGIDMWGTEHAVSAAPLVEACPCYACTKHHRAYIQHLLSAKEMLGWVLIQIHNHATLSTFFASIRASIEAGTFDADVAAFEAFYEPQLPEETGQGPRQRGYHHSTRDRPRKEKKINPKAYRKLEEDALLKAAHGQQPNRKPEMKDVIDDEALMGLVDMEDADGEMQMGNLSLEDDKTGGKEKGA